MKKVFAIMALMVSLCFGLVQIGYGRLPTQVDNHQLPSLAPMLKAVMPSVVNVAAVGDLDKNANPFARRPQRNNQPSEQSPNNEEHNNMPNTPTLPHKFQSMGSGVIVDAEKGYILTNAHVIAQADRITVTLSDGRQYKAKLVGADNPSDIAVLQIQGDNLIAAHFANSDNLQVGDFVAAIGTPFGLTQTVTSGIISALQRNDLHLEGFENFIQTDASINPGNSGGGLVNLKGELIGINTAILTPAGGSVGIGFAIPSNMAQGVMKQIIQYGRVRRGLMGILVQNFTPKLAHAFNLKDVHGAIITQVTPNSPAEKAGLRAGDVVLKVNGKTVKNNGEVRNIIGLSRAGNKIKIQINRDGKILDYAIRIQDPKSYQEQTQAKNPFLFGISMKHFAEKDPLHGDVDGILVLNVAEGTRAWQGALRPGDIIVSANRKAVNSVTELEKIANNNKDALVLNVIRGQGALFLVIQ